MAKAKTKEEAKEALKAAKEEHSVAKTERRNFEKENKLAKGEDHSANEKLGKKWGKLKGIEDKKQVAVEAAQEELNGLKSESAGRATTYEYPKDIVTAGDKKKYRAKMRAAKKKAEKGEEAPKEKKKKKEEPVVEAPKEKKKKKEKPTEEEED